MTMIYDGAACGMVGAVHVGIIQGDVTHAVYWLRSLSATQHRGRLADNGQYDDRCNLLRSFRRTLNHHHSIV